MAPICACGDWMISTDRKARCRSVPQPLSMSGAATGSHYENCAGARLSARLFRRFGNWSDTIAAYNWGPGNVDQWIARGRNAAQLPAETTRYIERVLQQAFMELIAGKTSR